MTFIPVRNTTEEELAAAARASWPLQAGRRLADWFGDDPVDAESGWRSAEAQRDAAMTLGIVARGDAMTGETISRLRWIYEVAYHAGYLHTTEDHELIHRAAALSGGAERTDAEIITDWCGALRQAAAPGSETVLFEQMWRSGHLIAEQALMTAGKLHPDKKIAKAAREASVKATSVRNSPRGG